MMDSQGARACHGYPVYNAAAGGSVEEVKELLKRGHSPDKSPTSCPPPLYRAVRFNRPDVALALIQAGCRARMSKRLEHHNSPIISIATDLKMTEVVLKMCLNPDCDVFATDRQLRTIVHLAVTRRNYDLVRRLPSHCSARKFLMLRDGLCLTPLHLAASLGDLTMLLLLLRMGDSSDPQLTEASSDTGTDTTPGQTSDGRNFQTTAVTASCHELTGNGQTTELQLIRAGPTLSVPGKSMSPENTSTLSTSHWGATSRPEISSWQSHSREDAGGTSPEPCLMDSGQFHASSEPHVREMAGIDQRDGVSANPECFFSRDRVIADCVSPAKDSGRPKYEWQSENSVDTSSGNSENITLSGHWKVKKELIDLLVLGSKETMLHFAARGHHLEVVDFLLSQGADVNAQNMMNNTPLHLLFMQGRANCRAVAVARLLLEAGADCSLKGTFQPVKKGSSQRHNGVNPIISDEHREVTVDMVAAIRNRVAFLRVLGEFGVQFDSINYAHMTTLMLALTHGSAEAARFLLTRHGEKSQFCIWLDRKGNTVFHHVLRCSTKAAALTQSLLERGYAVTMPSPYQPLYTCPVCSCFCQGYGGYDAIKWHSRNLSVSQSYSPLTWAISHKRLDVVEAMVKHDPSLLLRGYEELDHSPLHVVLKWMPDKECEPFIDFLLAHGSDGNAEVCGLTPYELAVQMKGERVAESDLYAANYLKKKLGTTFLAPDFRHCDHFGKLIAMVQVCPDHTHFRGVPPPRRRQCGHEVRGLRDMCLGPVQQLVRESAADYFAGISSLPLPSTVIDDLLFRNGK